MGTDKRKTIMRGQVMIIALFFFMAISTAISFGISPSIISSFNSAKLFMDSRRAVIAAESLAEDVAFRFRTGLSVNAVEMISFPGVTVFATTTYTASGINVESESSSYNSRKKIKMTLITGSGSSFFYGMQSDQGGLYMYNTSSVSGNVFSNGPVVGANSSYITGDVVSAGSAGRVEGVRSQGNVYAHNIINSVIDKDAYYAVISGSTVSGTHHSGSPDQATSTMPIPDSQIDEWKTAAQAGGLATCTSGSFRPAIGATIGPLKVPCDLIIDNIDPLYLAGPIWVTGNISFANTNVVRVAPSYIGRSMPIVAENPSNYTTSGTISVANSTSFVGAGSGSYVLLVSMNKSASLGGAVEAIPLTNTVAGDLLVYAPYGEISIGNSVKLKEVTAYKITIKNSAQVIYETGIANLLFSTGPGGGYVIDEWREI